MKDFDNNGEVNGADDAPRETLSLRWVLGTVDRVRVGGAHGEDVLSVAEVERRFGRSVVAALYLRGRSDVREDAPGGGLER